MLNKEPIEHICLAYLYRVRVLKTEKEFTSSFLISCSKLTMKLLKIVYVNCVSMLQINTNTKLEIMNINLLYPKSVNR